MRTATESGAARPRGGWGFGMEAASRRAGAARKTRDAGPLLRTLPTAQHPRSGPKNPMKTLRHLLGAVVVALVTAALFAGLDVYGLLRGGDYSVVPVVLLHVLTLTIVVGTWAFAMTFYEGDEAGTRHAT